MRVRLCSSAFLVALQHQGGGAPDIDLGYHGGQNCTLAVEKRLTPKIAWLANLPVTVAVYGADFNR